MKFLRLSVSGRHVIGIAFAVSMRGSKLEVKFSTIPKAVEYLGEICHDMCLSHKEHILLNEWGGEV